MKKNMRAKNTHPSRRPYREADSRGNTEPPSGKRGEEEDEKPIGRIGKRGAGGGTEPPRPSERKRGEEGGDIAPRQAE